MASMAVSHANGVVVELVHDLSLIRYTIDLLAFDDAVAFRHVISGAPDESRVPDEYTTFVVPAGSRVWHSDLSMHYESAYNDDSIEDVRSGQWAGPPVTFALPWGGYGLITEANLAGYAEMGVAGAKIDFFDHEAKEVVDLYGILLEEAAGHQMVLNFHGLNKPTGRERRWPNMLVTEAVNGMERRSFLERARHQTILPFTRYVAGPADYTTLIFGELSIFARRTGDVWLLAVMSGPEGRTIEVTLSFLGEGTYRAALVRDDADRDDAFVMEEAAFRRDDTLTIELQSGGGFVGRFVP